MKLHHNTNRENASALTFFDPKTFIAEQEASREESSDDEKVKTEMNLTKNLEISSRMSKTVKKGDYDDVKPRVHSIRPPVGE
jgi:hypothetical protein